MSTQRARSAQRSRMTRSALRDNEILVKRGDKLVEKLKNRVDLVGIAKKCLSLQVVYCVLTHRRGCPGPV